MAGVHKYIYIICLTTTLGRYLVSPLTMISLTIQERPTFSQPSWIGPCAQGLGNPGGSNQEFSRFLILYYFLGLWNTYQYHRVLIYIYIFFQGPPTIRSFYSPVLHIIRFMLLGWMRFLKNPFSKRNSLVQGRDTLPPLGDSSHSVRLALLCSLILILL